MLKILVLGEIHSTALEILKRKKIHVDQMKCVLDRELLTEQICCNCYNAVLIFNPTEIQDCRIPEIQMIKAVGSIDSCNGQIDKEMLAKHGVPFFCGTNTIDLAKKISDFLIYGDNSGIVNTLPKVRTKDGWRHKVLNPPRRKQKCEIIKMPIPKRPVFDCDIEDYKALPN